MYAGLAVRLKVVPVTPGAAACAEPSSSKAAAAPAMQSSRLFIEFAFFIVVALIACPLIDMNLCHQAAEVLGVIRQMVKVRRVQVVSARRYRCTHPGAAQGSRVPGRGANEARVQD